MRPSIEPLVNKLACLLLFSLLTTSNPKTIDGLFFYLFLELFKLSTHEWA
jgi:hypothetical protein